jgi:uncharacterized protein RhaS with RHS repeats
VYTFRQHAGFQVGPTVPSSNGQGTYPFVDGRKYVGEWKNGNRWLGMEYDKDGNITATYLDGTRREKE